MQEKLLFVDLISNHIQVVMTHCMENLPEHLVLSVCRLFIIIPLGNLNVVLGFFIVLLFIHKLSLRNFSSDNPPRGTLCTANGVMRSDAAARSFLGASAEGKLHDARMVIVPMKLCQSFTSTAIGIRLIFLVTQPMFKPRQRVRCHFVIACLNDGRHP